MAENFTTPIGRLLVGHPSVPTIRINEQTGEEKRSWTFYVGFPLGTFEKEVWPIWEREYKSVFPRGIREFASKVKRPDDLDPNNIRYGSRDGWEGLAVVIFASSLPKSPEVWTRAYDGKYVPYPDLKTGDFIRVNTSIKANNPGRPNQKASMFVNPNAVEFIAPGVEIAYAPNPETVFSRPLEPLPGEFAPYVISAPQAAPTPPAALAQQDASLSQAALARQAVMQRAPQATPQHAAPAYDVVTSAAGRTFPGFGEDEDE